MDRAAEDRRWMAATIRLSRWHLGATGSNPSVGCLIVKDGVIVGRGVTAPSGRPHAETQALAEAGESACGATAYVSLEPCSHHGRTPPCAEALISSGITRVVAAMTDPDPRVSGRGLAMLTAAGISVTADVLREQAESELEAYLNRQLRHRPQVILKLAVSADGMIGREGEGQVAITGREARAQSQILRAESDAILIGIGTALVDDPELTVRLPGLADHSPVRIVLDRRLQLPLHSKLVQGVASGHRLIVVGPPSANPEYAIQLEDAGVEIIDAVDLHDLLARLAGEGLSSLIVEGGARVAKAFLDQDLVDRIVLFSSAMIVGEGGIAAPITEHSVPDQFELRRTEIFGGDRCRDYIAMKM